MKPGWMLWLAVVASPLAWFLSMEANFALAPLACSEHAKWFLYAISAVAFLIAAAGALLAWSAWAPDGNGAPVMTQGTRALTLGAMIMGVSFAIVILAQAIPNLMLNGCE